MQLKSGSTPVSVVLIFLLPSLLGFLVFVFLPSILSLLLSFTKYSGGPLRTIRFIGLENFVRLFKSSQFWVTMGVTLKFVLGTVFLQFFLGFVFALMVNRPIRGRAFFRSMLFLPNMLSTVAISVSFALIFNPRQGPMNSFLVSFGLSPLPWLAGKNTALLAVMIVSIWQSYGFYMIIFLSGLQSISPTYYEAADIEGANEFRKFISITIPLLSPVTFLVIILEVIWSFSVFDSVFILTGGQAGGGPAGATSVIVYDIYKNAFSYSSMGYASAEAFILFIIVLGITLIQFRGRKRWVSYDVV